MKKSVAMKWVKALRSGKYEQGQRRLRNKQGEFCCLGVLCDISPYRKSYLRMKDAVGETNFFIPVKIGKWAGTLNLSIYNTLANMNDMGMSFEKIAKYIERKWKTL